MKKYYIGIIAFGLAAILLVVGGVFGYTNFIQNKAMPTSSEEIKTTEPAGSPAVPSGELQVSSPCEGVSVPVCGEDKKTYASQCLADFLGVKVASQGMCPTQVIQ